MGCRDELLRTRRLLRTRHLRRRAFHRRPRPAHAGDHRLDRAVRPAVPGAEHLVGSADAAVVGAADPHLASGGEGGEVRAPHGGRRVLLHHRASAGRVVVGPHGHAVGPPRPVDPLRRAGGGRVAGVPGRRAGLHGVDHRVGGVPAGHRGVNQRGPGGGAGYGAGQSVRRGLGCAGADVHPRRGAGHRRGHGVRPGAGVHRHRGAAAGAHRPVPAGLPRRVPGAVAGGRISGA